MGTKLNKVLVTEKELNELLQNINLDHSTSVLSPATS